MGEGGGGRSVGEGNIGEGGDYGGRGHGENGDSWGHWGWSGSRGIRGRLQRFLKQSLRVARLHRQLPLDLSQLGREQRHLRRDLRFHLHI